MLKNLENLFGDRTLLLIGGTGSLGNAFMELICSERFGNPQRVVVFSRDEAKQYYMRNKFSELHPEMMNKTHFRIGDIRDASSLRKVLRKEMDIIINMAALKHIPPYEYLPEEAIKNNKYSYRSLTSDGEAIEFSDGFSDLHTKVYEEIFAGRGLGIKDARPSIELVHKLRINK